MQSVLLMILGYILHDAVQPTAVGKVLDKVSLPSDLFVEKTVTDGKGVS